MLTDGPLPVTQTGFTGPRLLGPVNDTARATRAHPTCPLAIGRGLPCGCVAVRGETGRFSRQQLGPASGSRPVKEFQAVESAGVNRIPAAGQIPSPTRPHRRLWAVGRVAVTGVVREPMAASSPGLPGPRIIDLGDDGSDSLRRKSRQTHRGYWDHDMTGSYGLNRRRAAVVKHPKEPVKVVQ